MKQLVILSRVLDVLDGDTFATLDGRVAFQKRIYIAQAKGLDLGYKFVWSQYGPYSPELAQDGAELEATAEQVREVAARLELRPEAEQLLQRIRKVTEVPEGISLSAAAWLELLTSLHFLIRSRGLDPADIDPENSESIIAKLLGVKPYIPKTDAEVALEVLRSEGNLADTPA